jgi:hypothetical protein
MLLPMSLAIHHLDCHYVTPRGGPSEAVVRSRLDAVATNYLAPALRDRTEPLPGEDEALYFIEHMTVDAAVDAQRDDHGLAQSWAEALWKGLSRRLCGADGVVIFRDRAEYIVQFLLDLIAGGAESVWYYRELLEPPGLPLAQRATRVLTEDADTGRDAIVHMHQRGRLQDLLNLLGEAGSHEVISRCILPLSPDVFSAASFRRWMKALREVLVMGRAAPSGRPAQDTLLLYLELLAAWPDLGPDVNLARFLSHMIALSQSCGRLPALSQALHQGDWQRIRPCLESAGQARFLASLMEAVPSREISSLIEQLQPAAIGSMERSFLTDHAGIFLLAHPALEVDVNRRLAPLAGYGADAHLPIFLVALQCLGAPNVSATCADPGIAAFAGLSAPASPDLVATALSTWDLPALPSTEEESWFTLAKPGGPLESFNQADEFLRPASRDLFESFVRRLGAFSASSPAYVYRNFLQGRGMVSISPGRVSVRFLTCPMRTVLRMAGFGNDSVAIPWANAVLELDLE